MDTPGDGRRRRFARLRAWNRRSAAWARRHPWRNAFAFATALTLGSVVATVLRDDGQVLFPVAMWLTAFTVNGLMGRRRAREPEREPLLTPPTDLTLRGDSGPVMDADGRRWRTGSP